jgi:alpha-galactosidase
MPENTLFSYRSDEKEEALFDKRHPAWARPEKIFIDRDWMGRSLLREKGIDWKNLTQAASLWNDERIHFRFDCWFETLNIDEDLARDRSVRGLWENDVVEIFLKPEARDDYFEIEISPLGQWLDAHIRMPRIDVNFHWSSGLGLDVSIDREERIWRLFVSLPVESFAGPAGGMRPPVVGEVWRANFCRIAGDDPEREYLAWRPTFTPRPDFHVPASFGNLFFLEE